MQQLNKRHLCKQVLVSGTSNSVGLAVRYTEQKGRHVVEQHKQHLNAQTACVIASFLEASNCKHNKLFTPVSRPFLATVNSCSRLRKLWLRGLDVQFEIVR